MCMLMVDREFSRILNKHATKQLRFFVKVFSCMVCIYGTVHNIVLTSLLVTACMMIPKLLIVSILTLLQKSKTQFMLVR